MLKETLTVSALIAVILLVRAVFRNRVPKRMIYGLWLIVLLRLCLPGTLISLPILPPEEKIAPVQTADVQPPELPAQTAPAIQMPAQTASADQHPSPAMPPITQPQESMNPTSKALTSVQVLQRIWICGSVLLGLWMLVSWLVFLIRLRKNRCFLGRHGKTCIYVSSAVKSPCLAGLVPAVYLTQDVLKNETTELILQHELAHLHHLDFLWSFCRTAAVAVYWWNPFIWVAAIVSKRDAELACDEAVAAKLDTSARLAYANAILALAPRKQAALSLAGSPVKERILFLTKKQRTSVLCVILTLALIVIAAGCSVTELTQKKSGEITLPEQKEETPAEQPIEEAPVKDGWVLDADTLTDEKLLEIVLTGEIALAGENSFTFDDPRELSSQALYTLFLAFSDYDELTRGCLDETSGDYIIPAAFISEKLSRYFKAFDFDITKVRDYTPEKDAVVTKQVSGFGGDRFTNMTEKTIDGNLVTLTLDFFDNWEKTGNPYMRKTYALEFYDGGYYYLLAQANHAPLPNNGTYDVTQPLQAWELTRTDGVQTGLTLAQLEEICGELTQGENGYTYFDSRNILYDIFDFSNAAPTLQKIAYVGVVKDNEIVYTTGKEETAFRGIRLGDPIESVLEKFPCKDLEPEKEKTQVLYGTEASDSYAKLHYIVDDCYGLSFYLSGQWRAEIYFSRVQQRVYRMEIFSENYWKAAEDTVK